jgi:hypothetical protein
MFIGSCLDVHDIIRTSKGTYKPEITNSLEIVAVTIVGSVVLGEGEKGRRGEGEKGRRGEGEKGRRLAAADNCSNRAS